MKAGLSFSHKKLDFFFFLLKSLLIYSNCLNGADFLLVKDGQSNLSKVREVLISLNLFVLNKKFFIRKMFWQTCV